MNRRGPVSLAQRLQDNRVDTRKAEEPTIEVQSLWTMKHFTAWIRKGRTAADAFLKSNPDFPRVKIGGELRFDPDLCREWLRRKMTGAVDGKDCS
jgi:hypothetical protein